MTAIAVGNIHRPRAGLPDFNRFATSIKKKSKKMALDGASLMIVRQALNAFCEFHNISLLDEIALEAADQLVKMVVRGEGGLEVLRWQLEDWLSSYLKE